MPLCHIVYFCVFVFVCLFLCDEMYRDTRGDKVKYGSFKRTSEFELEIGVCFVGNWNLFSKIGICFAK